MNLPAPTETFITLPLANFLKLSTPILQAIENARIKLWTHDGWIRVGLSLPEFSALLQMFPEDHDFVPKTYSGTAGEA